MAAPPPNTNWLAPDFQPRNVAELVAQQVAQQNQRIDFQRNVLQLTRACVAKCLDPDWHAARHKRRLQARVEETQFVGLLGDEGVSQYTYGSTDYLAHILRAEEERCLNTCVVRYLQTGSHVLARMDPTPVRLELRDPRKIDYVERTRNTVHAGADIRREHEWRPAPKNIYVADRPLSGGGGGDVAAADRAKR